MLEYQQGFASVVYNFFYKKCFGGAMKSEIMSNQQLAEELHKLIILKFEKRKVYSSVKDNILGADFVDMQLISKCNKILDFYYVLLLFIVNTHGLIL